MSFMEIFNPGLRHLRQERQRQRLDVVYPTGGTDPQMEIDLDAGTAVIVVPPRADLPNEPDVLDGTGGPDEPDRPGELDAATRPSPHPTDGEPTAPPSDSS